MAVVPEIVQRNPNATTATGATGVSVAVVWLLGLAGVSVSPEIGVVIAGAVTTTVLAFAHQGILGVWTRLLHGNPPPR